jgi:hypothetical protein
MRHLQGPPTLLINRDGNVPQLRSFGILGRFFSEVSDNPTDSMGSAVYVRKAGLVICPYGSDLRVPLDAEGRFLVA